LAYTTVVAAAFPEDIAPVASRTVVVVDTVAAVGGTDIVGRLLDRSIARGDDILLDTPGIVALPAAGRYLAVVDNRGAVAVG
jgi:hypothetical protein